jgi:lipoate-protein ligase A
LLRENVYSQWSWNYGASPPCNIHKKRRIEGCGTVEIMLDVAKEGIIKTIVFYGDFFGREDPAELAAMLSGRHLEYGELQSALGGIDVSRYFYNLNHAAFFSLLLE